MRLRLAIAGFAFAIAGCATTTPSPASTATPSPDRPTASPAPTAPSGPVAIDPSLLDHLPTQVDGLDVGRSPESDAAAVADPVVAEFGDGIVTALVIDPASGDFAYATLVRLRPDAFSDELYRGWRDSFDQGACSQAGGVVRTALTEISGREVHIDTCEGGVRTYHVWLGNSRVLISVSALGDRKLGELLVEGLRD